MKNVAGENRKYHFYELGLWDKEDTLKNSLLANGYSLVCVQGNGNYTFVKNA